MFRDEIIINVKGGDGGDGCCSFRREKFQPKGGPDGGDGGDGGDVIIIAKKGLNSLYHITHKAFYRAGDGANGKGNDRKGKDGKDLIIETPCGTIIKDAERLNILRDLKKDGDSVIIAFGGKGGRGNKAFATSTNQRPTYYEKGQNGEELTLLLELKLIADVGLVGFPNAGKSTLLSKLSSARPKIADYPFTTLQPEVGIVAYDNFTTLTMADLPGLIENAHKGAGLGHKFLRHIERTKFILHLVDMSPTYEISPTQRYKTLREELEKYDEELSKKKEVIVGTKMDITGTEEISRDFEKTIKKNIIQISAVTGKGVKHLKNVLFETFKSLE